MDIKIQERKKFMKSASLIIFGILFYMMVGKEENLHWLYRIVQPLVYAFAIAYLLEPLVGFINRKTKISRKYAVLIIVVVIIGLIIWGVTAIPSFGKSITGLIATIDIDKIGEMINDFEAQFGLEKSSDIYKSITEVVSTGLTQLTKVITDVLNNAISSILGFTSGIFKFIVTLCIAIYMILDKDDLVGRIKRLLYAFNKKEKVDEMLKISSRANEIFKRFFIGKIIDSAIIGVICFVIMFIVGIPYPGLIALIVGITNMIPYFGPFIGGVPSVIIVMFIDMRSALIAGIIILALQQFDGLYLGPKILGDKVGVGAFWIIVSVTIGGAVMGVWGMLLGVPVTVLVKTLIEETVERRLKEKGLEDIAVDKIK